ncbi:MAG: putative metal-binding motif-containing protein [Patescibacteria group bacterium]|jgi:hypothetical protein
MASFMFSGCALILPDHIPLVDADGDGFFVEIDDCDDNDALVHPNVWDGDTDEENDLPAVEEIPCDGIDNDCEEGDAGSDQRLPRYADKDSDGFGDGSAELWGCEVYGVEGLVYNADDCDDTDPDINPSIPDFPGDGVDRNCDGKTTEVEIKDDDEDGFDGFVDCDDNNPTVNPVAQEVCDLIDNDCDLLVDDEDASVIGQDKFYKDADQDGVGTNSKSGQILACEMPEGYAAQSKDCDDGNAAVYPGAAESCTDPEDLNCDGFYGAEDGDGDGFFACLECDDSAFEVNPAATEVCDGVDNNCADGIDEGTLIAFYQDTDKDNYGSDVFKQACSAPAGYTLVNGDCDDARPAVNPDESEVCNDRDDDCDGVIDQGVLLTFYKDTDGDGFGGGTSTEACTPPAGYVANESDCNDASKSVNPSATEVCNSLDDNCDGKIDDNAADAKTWYLDGDKDGYGGVTSTKACSAPAGYVAASTDCDDATALVSPAGTEVCNGKDDNCDGSVDNGATGSATYYRDSDNDGYGDSSKSVSQCSPPAGYVLNATDCDDAKSGVNPGKTEVCNGVDDDCEGGIDEGVKNTYFADTDGDQYGNVLVTTLACSLPVGFAANSTDCDDTKSLINPVAAEACNGADDDCDTAVDEGVKNTYYQDGDGDAYGIPTSTIAACSAPAGFASVSTDCNDTDKFVNPGAVEVCDGVDNNCGSGIDEGVMPTFFQDLDADGYGTSAPTKQACSAPVGYASAAGDCDDRAPFVHPGVAESSKTASDDNCDGTFAHTDGVTTFAVSGSALVARFTGPNLIGNSCDVTMGCGALSSWTTYSYTLGRPSTWGPTGPLAFTTTLGSTRNAAYFDNTGGAAGIADECRAYTFTAGVGNKYAMTFDYANQSSTNGQILRVYRLSDYVVDHVAATELYSTSTVLAGTDRQVVTWLTAGNTTEGFVLCAGGVTATDLVGFTEAWIGAATVQ